MRIFVAGATGAVGRRLVRRLVRAGHSVTGLTHTPSKAGFVRELGAEPVVADALDERPIRAAVVAAHPDVIVYELTDLKGASDLRKFDRAFAISNRLRTLELRRLAGRRRIGRTASARRAGRRRAPRSWRRSGRSSIGGWRRSWARLRPTPRRAASRGPPKNWRSRRERRRNCG
jgi:nucleoside-diphosphate-sugar epimerase